MKACIKLSRSHHQSKKQTSLEKDYSLNNVACKHCNKEGELKLTNPL